MLCITHFTNSKEYLDGMFAFYTFHNFIDIKLSILTSINKYKQYFSTNNKVRQ